MERYIFFGDEIKATDAEGGVGGYLVRFSDSTSVDLDGDYFTKATNFGPAEKLPIMFHHGLDPVLKATQIGEAEIGTDDVGVWIKGWVNRQNRFIDTLYKQGVLGGRLKWSSGAMPKSVERKAVGRAYEITQWLPGEASLTFMPRDVLQPAAPAIKALEDLDAPENIFQTEFDLKPQQESVQDSEPAVKADTEPQTLRIIVENNTTPVEKTDEVAAPAPQPVSVKGFTQEDMDNTVAAALKAFQEAQTSTRPEIKAQYVTGLNLKTQPGDSAMKAYSYWMKTGDVGAYKASNAVDLQEGTSGEGGVLVPTDHANQIVARRDEMSIPRASGARIFTTNRSSLEIPVDNEPDLDMVLTAEEATYDKDTPNLSSVTVTAYKYTKLMKISEELLEDETSGLMSFIADYVGRSIAYKENAITLVGTGSGQPQGIFVGGTNGKTFAGAAAITAAEVKDLYYSLPSEYRNGATWATANATEASIRSLTGNPFLYDVTPAGSGNSLMGHRIFNSESVAAMTTGNKSISFANWNYYALVQRSGLTVKRLNERYADTGQVGFLFSFRLGGAVLQSEAIKYGTQA